MDLLQHIQRGIPAAKVVHPHLEAQLLEAFDLALHEIEIAADDALRDLNGQHTPVDLRLIDTLADFLHDIAGLKVRA